MQNAAIVASGPDGEKRRVYYLYESEIGDYYADTARIRVVYKLIISFNLQYKMGMYCPPLANVSQLTQFHSPEYIEAIRTVTLENVTHRSFNTNFLSRFNLDAKRDVTAWYGLFKYCSSCAGSTIAAAKKLNLREVDIAINWAGGMNTAKRDQASGVCYVNDVVLGILELLKTFKRVLYIDIGLGHGDAVEKAFYDTDRVMTVSFHQVGDSGKITDVGEGRGKYFSLNAPLKDGLDDACFHSLLFPIIYKAVEIYQPEAIVLQSGADSIACDASSKFNLSIEGHASCLRYLRTLNVPLLVLGGGGSLPNAANCWLYETTVALGLTDEIFRPYFKALIKMTWPIVNSNTEKEIADIRHKLLLQLSQVMRAPTVQFRDIPSISEPTEAVEVDMEKRQDESDSDDDWHFLG